MTMLMIRVILTQWDRVTHICISKLTKIGLDNGLFPDRRQAIIWTNAGILVIGPLGTNVSEIVIETAFENVVWKMAAILSRPQYVNSKNDDDGARTWQWQWQWYFIELEAKLIETLQHDEYNGFTNIVYSLDIKKGRWTLSITYSSILYFY